MKNTPKTVYLILSEELDLNFPYLTEDQKRKSILPGRVSRTINPEQHAEETKKITDGNVEFRYVPCAVAFYAPDILSAAKIAASELESGDHRKGLTMLLEAISKAEAHERQTDSAFLQSGRD